MANVKMIPAQAQQTGPLRVAAYCRVSSDSADQLHSYAAQIKNYTQVIGDHDDWEMVDVYADEGLTGTRMDTREDFNRMLADCRKGKIDKILVKSISRFARNTRDCLSALRELSQLGVGVQFEKENIDTKTLTTEFLVSVFGSMAQQESISISQNQRMSYQRRMERGEFISCKAPFGYKLVNGKDLEIIPQEAYLVRWVFNAYLEGHSLAWIAAEMTKKGVHTTDGRSYWQETTVSYLLSNEKYIGDSLTQKTYATAFPYRQVINHGERDQYYIENTHPAIIDPVTFQKANALLKWKGMHITGGGRVYPLTLKIICADCGTPFLRRQGKSGRVVWVCRKHDKNASACSVGRIPENEIYAAFVRMYNTLRDNVGIILTPAIRQIEELNCTLQRDDPAMLEINQAIAQATEQSYNISKLQTAGLLDHDVYAMKLNHINSTLAKLRADRRRHLQNEDLSETLDALQDLEDTIKKGPIRLEGFDAALFEQMVDRIIAESTTSIRFQLHGGLELRERLTEVAR